METGSNKEGHTRRTVSTQKGELKTAEGALTNWDVLCFCLNSKSLLESEY